MTQRTDRVDELLRQEIGVIIARDIADPRIGFVTITRVETTSDLSHAKVWVSVIGAPDEQKAALGALAHAMPFIRRELGARLRLRRIPDLHVRADDTLERGTRVLRLLSELESGTDPAAVGATAETLPTPVARLPHEGDAPEPPTEAVPTAPRARRRGRPSAAVARRSNRASRPPGGRS